MAARKTPPFSAYKEWTTAKFFGFIRSGLREKFNRWPPKYQAIKQSSRTVQVTDDHGGFVRYKSGKKVGEIKTANEYQCNECKNYFKQTEVQVDHKEPAGTLKDFNDLPTFVEKMFCSVEDLQVLCKPCHQSKTNKEKLK